MTQEFFTLLRLKFSSITCSELDSEAVVTWQNFNEKKGKKNKSGWGSYFESFTRI